MKRVACLTAGLAALGLQLAAASAEAQPSIWDKARDPAEAKAYQALVAVERMLSRAEESDFDFGLQRNFTRAALAMLELAGGGALPDPRLKILLADLLLDTGIGREAEARTLLEEALARDSRSPLAVRGWFTLAIASAKLGDPVREHEAYTRALELSWEADERANILLNRGESRMVLSSKPGATWRMADAIDDFRSALRLATRPDLQALALYSLGTALERSGDLPSALDAMARARSIQLGPVYPSALDLPSVFYVPRYDLYYYKALDALAAAKLSTDVIARAEALEQARGFWTRYLQEAEADGHVWVGNARLHLASTEKKLAALQPELERARRARPPAQDDASAP